MGTYVEDCLENMYLLPSEIKRNFDLMRELDKTSYPLLEELKTTQKAYLTSARQKVLARCADATKGEATEQELRELIEADEMVQTLQEQHALVVQKLDEKIAIAAQSYDIVDRHIRRLDRDLESYAALLKANGEYQEDSRPQRKKQRVASATTVLQVQSHAAPHVAHVRSKQSTVAAGTGLKDRTATPVVAKASSISTSSTRKRSVAEAAVSVPAAVPDAVILASEDLPIDPNEPIYCSCRRVSFGQMVGCDNDDCKYEWFHFGCVGLTDQPAGQWYCPDCKTQLGIK
ncbi:AhpC/TSA family Redoxin [Phytophthora megakarya]|uniref:Inhibitor of growth protein n=1 Tax=Phytophthora megakarya TaxID=4795 RepID=A0A225WVL3_9STRA|nr:AhpC/TSA family Redoxin [Phytophthora megakarya]